MQNKAFKIITTGCGGEGVITLSKIICQAAILSGLDVKMAEVHGLAQRGGHLECHIKFGQKVYSSLIKQADANLIIALEPIEALRCLHYASNKTSVVFNTGQIVPLSTITDKKSYPDVKQVIQEIKCFTKKVKSVDGTERVKRVTQTNVSLNIFMLGFAFYQGYLPLTQEKLFLAIKTVINPKYFVLNKKVFQSAEK